MGGLLMVRVGTRQENLMPVRLPRIIKTALVASANLVGIDIHDRCQVLDVNRSI